MGIGSFFPLNVGATALDLPHNEGPDGQARAAPSHRPLPGSTSASLPKGRGAEARLRGLFAQQANQAPQAKINNQASAMKIGRTDVGRLNNHELMSMSLALHIPPTGDMHMLREGVAARFTQFNEVMAAAMGRSAHGFPVKRELCRLEDFQLDDPAWQSHLGLSKADAEVLKTAGRDANMAVIVDNNGSHPIRISLYFYGSSGSKGLNQHLHTMLGVQGDAYKSVRDAAGVFAGLLEKNPGRIKVDMVSGISMGGGCAQYFKAALESKVALDDDKPAMILLDPQLLNNTQGRKAAESGPLGYDYNKLHGVAVTLDYSKEPRKSLMDRMETAGYAHPGVLRLNLDLQDNDAIKFGPDRLPLHSQKPKPVFMLGYHGQNSAFEAAIHRFAGSTRPE